MGKDARDVVGWASQHSSPRVSFLICCLSIPWILCFLGKGSVHQRVQSASGHWDRDGGCNFNNNRNNLVGDLLLPGCKCVMLFVSGHRLLLSGVTTCVKSNHVK